MPLSLHIRTALSLAVSVLASAAVAQMPPMMSGDPFAGGAYAVPTGAPIDLSMGAPMPGGMMPGTTLSSPMYGDPMMGGSMMADNSVFMAPEIVNGGGFTDPNCPSCFSGGGAMPGAMPYGANMMADPNMGMPMGAPMGMPMDPGMGMPMGPSMGVPMNGVDGPEMIYPGFVDPTATIPSGTGFSGFGAPMAPPVVPPQGIYHGAGVGQRCGWAAGFTWVFLKPHYGSNDSFYMGHPVGGAMQVSNQEFSYSLELSPRVFLEWVAPNDLGVRVTWFSMNNDADTRSAGVGEGAYIQRPISPTEYYGGRITADNEVDVNVLDFDMTQRLRVNRSLLNVGGGLRWANYEQNYKSVITGPDFGQAVGNGGQQFNGFGPSLFAEWRRPLGETRFSLLATVRGSMLYGDSKTDIYEVRPDGSAYSFRSNNDDFVAIGESQLGVEWSAWISDRTVLFAQTAFETQYWMGVGTAFDRNDDLGLIGMNVTLGLEW